MTTIGGLALADRVLLRQTVNGAESPDERAAVDANDLASREQALERRQRPRVVATIAEGRDEQSAVDEIEAPLLASPSTARLQETTDQ